MRPAIRIFIVDDHPLVRDWLSTLLRQQRDIEICGQADGIRTALAAMNDIAVDIAIVDLALNDGSGLDLIRALKKQMPAVQVIVLSMHEETGYVERAFRAGARGYVTKRESTGQIVEAIRQVRAGRIYANPWVLGELAERALVPGRVNGGNPVDTLSDRELEVFRRLGHGQATRTIALELGVSLPTVHTYCMRMKEKLGLTTAAELLRAAVRWTAQQEANTGQGPAD